MPAATGLVGPKTFLMELRGKDGSTRHGMAGSPPYKSELNELYELDDELLKKQGTVCQVIDSRAGAQLPEISRP